MTLKLLKHWFCEELLTFDFDNFKSISKDGKVEIESPAKIDVNYLADETKVEVLVTQEVKAKDDVNAFNLKLVIRGIISSDVVIEKDIVNFPHFCYRLIFPYIQAEVKRLSENTGLSPVFLNGEYDKIEVVGQ